MVKIEQQGQQRDLVERLIVHGSYGDFTFTNFSDLEVTVCLRDRVFDSNEKKKQLRKWVARALNPFIYAVDPLQHHGAFFLWGALSNNYDETILPIEGYDMCWSTKPETINVFIGKHYERFASISERRFRNTLNALRSYSTSFFKYGQNLYSIKRLISNLLLLPAFYYQAQGLKFSKRKSIEAFMSEFPNSSAAAALGRASQIRRDWPEVPRYWSRIRQVGCGTRIPSGRKDLVAVNLFRSGYINKRIEDELLPEVASTVEEFGSR